MRMTVRRWWPTPFAVLVFLTGGCATAYQQGQSALREERYADAATRFEEALQKHPDSVDALVGLGIARYEQGAYDEAASALARVVGREPKHRSARIYLGLSELRRGDDAAAEEHLRAFHDVADDARLAQQVDDALRVIAAQRPLLPETRQFIARSLESAVKANQELREARQRYVRGPYLYDPLFYDPFFYDPFRPWGFGPRCFVTRHGRVACF